MKKAWSSLQFFLFNIGFFILGLVLGAILVFYYFNRQIKKQLENFGAESQKKQVQEMLSALGQKPSEEQINRIMNMAKSLTKKSKKK